MKAKIALVLAAVLVGGVQVSAMANPPPGSVAELENSLSSAASYAEIAEFKAKLKDEENDLSWRTLGHGVESDDDAYGEAYKKSYEEGKAACKAWMEGKPAKVRAAAKVYCSMWESTLVAEAQAHARYEQFAATPGGAQLMRAQAELEAAAEE